VQTFNLDVAYNSLQDDPGMKFKDVVMCFMK